MVDVFLNIFLNFEGWTDSNLSHFKALTANFKIPPIIFKIGTTKAIYRFFASFFILRERIGTKNDEKYNLKCQEPTYGHRKANLTTRKKLKCLPGNKMCILSPRCRNFRCSLSPHHHCQHCCCKVILLAVYVAALAVRKRQTTSYFIYFSSRIKIHCQKNWSIFFIMKHKM